MSEATVVYTIDFTDTGKCVCGCNLTAGALHIRINGGKARVMGSPYGHLFFHSIACADIYYS
jgi:hypothetical protein